MYAFGVCEPRVVTVISCVLKASCFIHRDFTHAFPYVVQKRNIMLALMLASLVKTRLKPSSRENLVIMTAAYERPSVRPHRL